MPIANVNDISLHYQLDGDASLPCVVLSNSLGTDLSMWEPQAAALAQHYRVLRYDTRGHGQSGAGEGPTTLAQLGQDVVALLDHLGIGQAHFCGISMGGMTGQWLGVHAAGRFGKLALANTAARIGSEEGWSSRAALVRAEGMDKVADGAAERWFTADFIAANPQVVDRMVARLRGQSAEGYAACCDALAVADLREQVASIPNPTLVIAGEHDPVTTVDDGHWMRERIPNAQLVSLPASHISNIEAAEGFTAALLRFLAA